MELTINNKVEESLLERVLVKGTITFKAQTPSNLELGNYIAKELNVDPNLIVLKQIANTFGQKMATFSALVYKNFEAKDKAEKMTKHLRKKAEENRKKAEEEAKVLAEVKEAEKVEEDATEVKEEVKESSDENNKEDEQ